MDLPGERADAHVMDFSRLDFAEATFDAVYALNCLVHVPKSEIGGVLVGIHRVMKPNGLLYVGMYGGQDSEGIWEQDHYEPKRFFSFHTDEQMKSLVNRYFHIEIFNIYPDMRRIYFSRFKESLCSSLSKITCEASQDCPLKTLFPAE